MIGNNYSKVQVFLQSFLHHCCQKHNLGIYHKHGTALSVTHFFPEPPQLWDSA